MNSVEHEPFKKNFNETGETPNEVHPQILIMPVIKRIKI